MAVGHRVAARGLRVVEQGTWRAQAQCRGHVPQAGFYELTGSIRVDSAANGPWNGERYLAILVDDQLVAESTSFFNGIVVLNASATVYLTADQTVKMRSLNHSGAALDMLPLRNPPRLSGVQLPTTMPS